MISIFYSFRPRSLKRPGRAWELNHLWIKKETYPYFFNIEFNPDKSLDHPDWPPGIIGPSANLGSCLPGERYKTVKAKAILERHHSSLLFNPVND